MTKTFWLSFADNARAEGQQFLGVCLVDVTDEDAADARTEMLEKFPHATPGAEWTYAATAVAWQMGCNPGGGVASWDITDTPKAKGFPKNRLLKRRQLDDLERDLRLGPGTFMRQPNRDDLHHHS